ncbi:MAG: hypothetical protein WKF90_11275 [Pyrinomonadaceae bacterium]
MAAGFVPLLLSWNAPWLHYAVLVYDVLLIALALVDYFVSRDLNKTVSEIPSEIRDVFMQSAEEIIRQREAALKSIETLGGLALDVATNSLAPRLLETYLRVKEKGLL